MIIDFTEDEASMLKTAAMELLQDEAERLHAATYGELHLNAEQIAAGEARMISLSSAISKLSRA